MKKSWHPLIRNNLEKVWIVETKKKEEQAKIAQLLKEKIEERSLEDIHQIAVAAGLKKESNKLDWMYQGMYVGML